MNNARDSTMSSNVLSGASDTLSVASLSTCRTVYIKNMNVDLSEEEVRSLLRPVIPHILLVARVKKADKTLPIVKVKIQDADEAAKLVTSGSITVGEITHIVQAPLHLIAPCFACNKYGHMARNCDSKAQDASRSSIFSASTSYSSYADAVKANTTPVYHEATKELESLKATVAKQENLIQELQTRLQLLESKMSVTTEEHNQEAPAAPTLSLSPQEDVKPDAAHDKGLKEKQEEPKQAQEMQAQLLEKVQQEQQDVLEPQQAQEQEKKQQHTHEPHSSSKPSAKKKRNQKKSKNTLCATLDLIVNGWAVHELHVIDSECGNTEEYQHEVTSILQQMYNTVIRARQLFHKDSGLPLPLVRCTFPTIDAWHIVHHHKQCVKLEGVTYPVLIPTDCQPSWKKLYRECGVMSAWHAHSANTMTKDCI